MKEAPASSSSGPSREESGEQEEEGWISRYMGTLLWVDVSWRREKCVWVCTEEAQNHRYHRSRDRQHAISTSAPPLLLLTTTDSLPSLTGSRRPGG